MHGSLLHKLYWRRAFFIFRGGQSRPPRSRGHGKSWLNRGGWLCPPRLTDSRGGFFRMPAAVNSLKKQKKTQEPIGEPILEPTDEPVPSPIPAPPHLAGSAAGVSSSPYPPPKRSSSPDPRPGRTTSPDLRPGSADRPDPRPWTKRRPDPRRGRRGHDTKKRSSRLLN